MRFHSQIEPVAGGGRKCELLPHGQVANRDVTRELELQQPAGGDALECWIRGCYRGSVRMPKGCLPNGRATRSSATNPWVRRWIRRSAPLNRPGSWLHGRHRHQNCRRAVSALLPRTRKSTPAAGVEAARTLGRARPRRMAARLRGSGLPRGPGGTGAHSRATIRAPRRGFPSRITFASSMLRNDVP